MGWGTWAVTPQVYLVVHHSADDKGDMCQNPVIPLQEPHVCTGMVYATCYCIKFTVTGFTGEGSAMQPTALVRLSAYSAYSV